MEEEIITPEEEAFDYNKLRYILTSDGYICHVSLGGLVICDLGECTEYNGDIPDGYETIEEWYEEENERLNAWKIVDGNLAFDPKKYETLKAKCEKEHEDNRYVCHKEISNITNLINSDSADNYKKSTTNISNILEVIDSNKFASEYIKLVSNENLVDSVTIKFNNGNLLTNDATFKIESGISFEVNVDRSIFLKGTATEDIEFNIGGTPNNTKPILAFKKDTNYYLSSNGYQIKMYYYDGTDRTEIYNGNGGIINLSANANVTNIVLFIPSGTSLNNVTIYPMLNLGTEPDEYITYEGNETKIHLEEHVFNNGDEINIDNGFATLQNMPVIGDDLIIGNDFIIGGYSIYLEECIMPLTYLNKTYMYTYEDINLLVTYPNTERNLDLRGYETPNEGFGIDEEGNMYANNGTFRGNVYFPNSNSRVIGGNGLLTNLIYNGYTRGEMIVGSGDYIPLGRVGGGNTLETQRNDLVFAIDLPYNFTVISAKMYLSHAPIDWKMDNSIIAGCSRNLKLYKTEDISNLRISLDPSTGSYSSTGITYSEVPNALGTNGFTGSDISTTYIESIDLKDYILEDEVNYFAVRDSDTNVYTNNNDIFSRTGGVFGYIEIIGYMKIESEE